MQNSLPIPTAEEIKKHYLACFDSINLINSISTQLKITQQDVDSVKRNIQHLQIMLTRTYWTTEDLKPLQDAVLVVVTIK